MINQFSAGILFDILNHLFFSCIYAFFFYFVCILSVMFTMIFIYKEKHGYSTCHISIIAFFPLLFLVFLVIVLLWKGRDLTASPTESVMDP